MKEILNRFAMCGEPAIWGRFGNGHINETYLVTCDTGMSYILQKLSRAAFKKPDELMANISAVCAFLAKQTNDRRGCLHLVPTVDESNSVTDSEGSVWRMYEFIRDSVCLQKVERPEELYKTAYTFGCFQRQMSDFPVDSLFETIENFHNTPDRYRLFHEALEKDPLARRGSCRTEIDFALKREAEAGEIVSALKKGLIPLRVTHNDTKLNNIMLDYFTREPLCVIDLDTVMPGSALYDFGDIVRFGASTAAEDETELSRVGLDLELYATACEGFIKGCGAMLTKLEKAMLPVGAKLMTLECGLRFLTDYLLGDTYFRISRPEHNLERCRTQFKLVQDMEEKWDKLGELSK